MFGTGEEHVHPRWRYRIGDPAGVGGDDQPVDSRDLPRTLDDPGDQGCAAEQLQRFLRESRRADAGRNHQQNRHDTSYLVARSLSKCVPNSSSEW